MAESTARMAPVTREVTTVMVNVRLESGREIEGKRILSTSLKDGKRVSAYIFEDGANARESKEVAHALKGRVYETNDLFNLVPEGVQSVKNLPKEVGFSWFGDASGLDSTQGKKLSAKLSELFGEKVDYFKGNGPLAFDVSYVRDRRLLVVADVRGDSRARVVVVVEDGREATAPQTPARLLRLEKGEMLEVTLPDGQKMRLNAIEATVRRE